MKNLQTGIEETIQLYFDKDLINREDLLLSSPKIKDTIAKLTMGTFDWKDKEQLLGELYDKFGEEYIFESQVHFYCNDRCLQLYVAPVAEKAAISTHYLYFFRVSIFNYFQVSVVNKAFFEIKDLTLIKDKPKSTLFIDEHQNEFCDAVFDVIKKYYNNITWIPSAILEKTIYSLRIMDGIINKTVTVADILFRDHS